MKTRIAIISMMVLLCTTLLYCAPNDNNSSNNNNRGNDKYNNAENILNDPSLSLTAKQKSDISACIEKHRKEGAQINRKIAAINREIGQEMRAHVVSKKEIDKDKIKKLIVDKKMLEAEMEYLTISTDLDILSHLDEKQLKILRDKHKNNRPRE